MASAAYSDDLFAPGDPGGPEPDLMTVTEIARAIGTSKQNVSQQLQRYGVQPDAFGRYSLAAFQRRRQYAMSARPAAAEQAERPPLALAGTDAQLPTLEEVRRDDLAAATRLKRLRIAEAEQRLIARPLLLALLETLHAAFAASLDRVLASPDARASAKAQLKSDYAALLKRLPRLLAETPTE